MEHPTGHVIPYPTLLRVWGALVVLTAILVFVSRAFHEALSVPAMLTITPLKAGLVFYFFMHLKYEGLLLKTMLLVALGTLLIFLGLLFSDVLVRFA
ncbi:MAG: cytochrome C oxidase subunit IV family protein [Acidobacteriia bacterium]|nr:cytochrome C oxidase subunit IV family protein [Terriglobia bacterium]